MLRLTKAAKIAGRLPYAFSLPAGKTCPGATKICAAACYAKKGRCSLPDAKQAWAHNLAALVRTKFAALESIPLDAPFFRVHVSGDFFSQAYIDRWVDVARSRPKTRFWAYTRSFSFDFSVLSALPNFTLFLSVDEQNKTKALELAARLPHARLAYGPFDHSAPLPPASIVCPATNGQADVKEACAKCGFCFRSSSKKSVVFFKH